MEYLDVLNDAFEPVGVIPREQAHATGALHRVVHVWFVSRRDGKLWVWFQQRAKDKADFPLFYDIATGGHVSAGENYRESVLREIWEEVGLSLKADDLCYLGHFREDIRFGGFDDRELCEVFLCLIDHPAFHPGEEVERMVCVPLERLRASHCGLEGKTPVYASLEDETPVEQTAPHQWCRHAEEFETLFLPELLKRVENQN